MSIELREALLETARAMNLRGINQGRSGNLSVRDGDDFLITPSALPYERMEAGDIVRLPLDSRDGSPAPGDRTPSSEWRIHRDVYLARPDAGALLHAHPVHCAALACLRKPLPSFHYMVAVAGGKDIRCAPYATFGTQALSDAVLGALEGRRACLMANHGLLSANRDLETALAVALEVEQLAAAYLAARAAGEPVLLDDGEMDRVIEKFRTYGPGAGGG